MRLNLIEDERLSTRDYIENDRYNDCIQGVLSLEEDEDFADRQVDIESNLYWWNAYYNYYNTEDEAIEELREPSKEKKKKDITPSESKYMRRRCGGRQKFGPPPRKC